MVSDPAKFKTIVQKSLQRQITAIKKLTDFAQLRFWDYGNAFLLEAKRAGATVCDENDPSKFIYPSYVVIFYFKNYFQLVLTKNYS